MTKIEFRNVYAEHKSGSKLIDVNMIIEDGEYMAVLGPTGLTRRAGGGPS